MKIAFDHIVKHIPSNPSIEDISNKLFQLGHEHEIHNNIFEMEFTPNRGDCLSIKGILRDLSVFYEINANSFSEYLDEIPRSSMKFDNKEKEICPQISFLRIDIDKKETKPFIGMIADYFFGLDMHKNNFFTDISNYVSYETGQPTHCYDVMAMSESETITLKNLKGKNNFMTLLDKKIELSDTNLVFEQGGKVINLAGVIGGKNSSCNADTTSVLVECAYFKPDNIIGKTVKYDIKSEAAHKFERGVDSKSQESVLRRFLKIVDDHATIKSIELFSQSYSERSPVLIPNNLDLINNILGTSVKYEDFTCYLEKLGFIVDDK